MVTSIASFLKSKWARTPANRRKARAERRALRFDALEPRALMALVGTEFHVNTETLGAQDNSAVACSSNGACVVAWSTNAHGDYDIRAQLYDANGDPVGDEIIVADSLNDEREPAVAMDSSGYFVVVWTEVLGAESDILAQQFTPDGVPYGDVIYVDATPLTAHEPSVAMSAAGDFVVVYTLENPDADVVAKMYDSDGTLFRQFYVAASGYDEHSPSVAMADNGRFAVAYQIDSFDGFNTDIRLRRYTELGGSLGLLRITNTRSRAEANPSVSMDNSGNAVVAYEVLIGGDWDIHARHVSSRGRVGPAFVVQNYFGWDETRPVVAMDRFTGEFVIAYQTDRGSAPATEVAEFSAFGTGRTTISLGSNRDRPAIAMDGSGFYLVTYTSFNRAGDPGAGIFGQFGAI